MFFSFGVAFADECRLGVDCEGGEVIERCCPDKGLVPCGTNCCPCNLCMFFVLIDDILDFLLSKIVPVVAVLMLVIGGVMFLVSTGNPGTITNARRIISSTLIGLAVIYGSFFFVGLVLKWIGLNQWTENIYSSWWTDQFFEIECNVTK